MYVIGTAGHVDHGKSALVQALTGIDPDRLQEEKERGMTIDLGFAWLRLPEGPEVSIVDVPGHERFVKNMLAGVGGIDLALLVVAADEGVMPQTQEHLAILDLLEVRHGVLVITKADLVDSDWLEMVAADVMAAVAGSTLEGSPLVTCSAVTGQGLDELLHILRAELAKVPPKRDLGRPRLPIDRAFTIVGFGTVVTGTLIDGSLTLGQEVEVVPGGLRSRVRGLQTHRRKVERAQPGRRTAVNLAGLSPDQLERGMVVTTPGWLTPTVDVDVRLRCVSYRKQPIRHNLHISFHSGAAEVPGRLRLLDRDALAPGETAWAQVRLARPVAVTRGDGFILRTANDTLGGGRVVDIHAPRHRRFHPPTLERLTALADDDPLTALPALLSRLEPCDVATLSSQSRWSLAETTSFIETLLREGKVTVLAKGGLSGGALLYSREGFAALTDKAREALAAHHRQYPLRSGMAKEELRSRLGLTPRAFNEILEHWLASGELADRDGNIALASHRPTLTPAQQAQAQAFLKLLSQSPYAPPTDRLPDGELLAYLEGQGQIVRVSEEVAFAAGAYQEMVQRISGHLRVNGTITLAQVRDMFGTSRKYAQALLEHLDQRRITRRVGDQRVLRSPETPAGVQTQGDYP